MVKTYGLKFKVDVDSKTNKMFQQQQALTEQLNRSFQAMNKNIKLMGTASLAFGTDIQKALKPMIVKAPKAIEHFDRLKRATVSLKDALGGVGVTLDGIRELSSRLFFADDFIDAPSVVHDALKKIDLELNAALASGTRLTTVMSRFRDVTKQIKGLENIFPDDAEGPPTTRRGKAGAKIKAGAGAIKAFGTKGVVAFKGALDKIPTPLKKIGGFLAKFPKFNIRAFKGGLGMITKFFGVMKKGAKVFGGLALGLLAVAMGSPAVQAQMAVMGASMQQISIIIGEALLPFFEGLNLILQTLIDTYRNLSPEAQMAIQIFMGLAVALGIAAIAVGVLGTAFTILSGPVGLILLAVAALAVAWSFNLGGIQDITDKVFGLLVSWFDALTGIIDKFATDPVGAILDAITMMIGTIAGLIFGLPVLITEFFGNLLVQIGNFARDFFGSIGLGWLGDIIGDILGGIGGFIANFAGGVFDILGGILSLDPDRIGRGLDKLNKAIFGGFTGGKGLQFAAGGIVPTGGDGSGLIGGVGPVPIMAHGGEMILNRQQQASLFNFIKAGGGDQNTTINLSSPEITQANALLIGGDLATGFLEKLRSRGI